MTACSGGEQIITGTLEKTDKGHVLKAEDGATTYRLAENQDFSAMVGKTVRITGTLMEREAGRTIVVTRMDPIEATTVTEEKEAQAD